MAQKNKPRLNAAMWRTWQTMSATVQHIHFDDIVVGCFFVFNVGTRARPSMSCQPVRTIPLTVGKSVTQSHWAKRVSLKEGKLTNSV